MRYFIKSAFCSLLIFLVSFSSLSLFAQSDKDFPERPDPPKLVNDFAGMLSQDQQADLERLLVDYDNTSSVQIAIVTINSLGAYEYSAYASELFKRWGIGQKDKANGVLIFVSKEDRKMFIATGNGINSVLTDAICGRIVREQMAPEFKQGNYYAGFLKASQSIIAASKGEYTNDHPKGQNIGKKGIPAIFIIIAVIIFIIVISGRKGGGGGGNYMSRRGSDFITGAILGSLLGGGRSSGGSWGGSSGGWGGGSDSGGGGFGGFGGGSTDGGGAGGSW